jgi:hypothetical protein
LFLYLFNGLIFICAVYKRAKKPTKYFHPYYAF